MGTTVRMVQQAYKFALDPTPEQARMLASHAGARRAAFNFAHAMISAGADAAKAQKDALVLRYLSEGLSEPEAARKAKAEVTIPIPRQMKILDPEDPERVKVLHKGVGVEWTEFKNTAIGCKLCRRLLARDPSAPDSTPWADARTGSVTCDPDALKRAGIDSEPGPHDPTAVGCGKCREPLRETPDGTWAGRDGSVACAESRKPGGPHEPSSDFMAWTSDVFPGTFQAAHRDADTAWQRFLKGKSRRPRFKKKGKSTESFQVHGDGLGVPETVETLRRGGPRTGTMVRQQTAVRITLPKIGAVRAMSDDSMHPAMRRSRHRATPGHERHMGNRRRFRHLRRHMRRSGEKAAVLGPLLRQIREDAGLTLAQGAAVLGAEADTRAMAGARARLAAAEDALAVAEGDLAAARDAAAATAEGDPAIAETVKLRASEAASERTNASGRLRGAQKRLQALEEAQPGEKASRTDRWSAVKLKKLEAAGVTLGLEQASVICAAYQLTGELRDTVMDLAAQARIIRATITLGADGIWWCSVGAEIPYATRTAPSKRQAARGTAGIDFGTARIMTVTGRRPAASPAHLEKELAALGTAQRHAARTVPGSARHAKAKAKAGLIHADVARLRADTLHRATTSLARNYAFLGFEGFNVQQMMMRGSQDLPRRARRRRNRSLADAGIGMGRGMIKYKALRFGATAVAVGPDAITITGPGPEDVREADLPAGARPNGTCSRCRQAKAKPARTQEVLYRCDACGRVRLRTLNSAENIRRWADEALTAEPGCAISGPDQSRGEDEPVTGRSPVKRAATLPRASPRGRTGTPGG